VENKPWYSSRTIWASIVAIAATAAALILRKNVTPRTQETITDFLAASIPQIVAIVSGIVVIWGRVKAETRIGNQ
jgi:hypothetical protein